ncbi:low molecular weight phosphatase family protein [Rubellimicrobium roseum]|uniref:Low molecular weight phosphatase family protein n=2 Tax=Rubellimicrobium roseum TaxID=687525 RepID=A0A5C4NAA5_9RHOB|nr:low molecular weight phosphatase family protein [Rubellimicrobium roseum]
MAEAMMKRLYGTDCYVQSAGVRSDREIDGFAIAVCQEWGLELSRHRTRSFDDMRDWGDDLSAYDLVVALTPASAHCVADLTRAAAVQVEHWPILDPTGQGEGREERLDAYRRTRDMILARLLDRFGPPRGDWAPAP